METLTRDEGENACMAGVILRNLTKVFNKVVAVNNVNLEIRDSEFMVLVGPSGCGKTTALRMIAGLEEATSGEIIIGDRVVNDVSPKDRDIAMVFQNYALYPHMNVYDNMSFGLRLKRVPTNLPWPFNTRRAFSEEEIDRRVNEAAEMLGLKHLLQRKPKELSGGQRQRVALGRAIVREPKVFLMDEPLSNLDAKLRVQTRAELIKLHRRLGITTVYVTHDQVEAMTMGDRIAVMNNGVIQQCDTPLNLYNHPANLFVAGFIGSPAMNFVPATIVERNGELLVDAGSFQVTLPPEQAQKARSYVGKRCIWGIRPEDIYDKNLPGLVQPTPGNTITVDVDVVEPLGSDMEMYLKSNDISLIAMVDSASTAKVGGKLEIVFDMAKSHLFDPETEQAIY
ncbi:MAG TPA: sn-glycerol-3-phosphate ABC transporter ATP-binding protein UgpC [Chthonomonas sp.]|nr:sn-glycerol-3-phosphate ABC transporter ATP-binding protein UgpC [Chthonomonas sp.]HLI48778.1 sn-glycerol-3-phosphate ABC transporter ATP-binding protein UgpC [Chthonomonas sp.]